MIKLNSLSIRAIFLNSALNIKDILKVEHYNAKQNWKLGFTQMYSSCTTCRCLTNVRFEKAYKLLMDEENATLLRFQQTVSAPSMCDVEVTS